MQMTIDGTPYNGEVGAVVLLNTTEEWTIRNATVSPPIDHPFHIHINPFQVTEVFDPNETIPFTAFIDPSTNKPLPLSLRKYVFAAAEKISPEQCVLDPNDPNTWKPCVTNLKPDRI